MKNKNLPIKNKKKKFDLPNRVLIIYLLVFILIIILLVPKEIEEITSIVGKVVASVRILGTNAPTFDHDLDNFTIYQNESLWYDINCSDIDPGDVITYSDNFTGFEINSSTGIINKTATGNNTIIFNQSFVGNNTIGINCSDTLGYSNITTFVLEILDVNEPPVLEYIGPQIATEGELFTLDIDSTEPENDTLSYNSSTTLFTIDNETGIINFTPTLEQVGNYTINISVFDGEFYDHEVISFRIVRGPYCGDDSCGSDDSCSTCPEDCGACPPPPAAEPGEVTTPDAEPQAVTPAREPYYRCDEKWECSEWSVCSLDGIRTKKCIDVNKCGTKEKKPNEIEECVYQPTCFDGIQNGGETGIDCGGPCEPCLVANCFDGIQNCHDGLCEEGIDCGGPCEPCEVKEFVKVPAIEIPGIFKIPRQFPWLLILIIVILLTLTVASDQIYLRKITKKEFEDYRESMLKYRVIRRRIYKFILNASGITVISSFYIYYFSNNIENLLKFSWIPIIFIVLTPICVSVIIRKYTYYEYEKRKKEQRLKQTHKRELRQLVKVENELLFDLEIKLKNRIYGMASKHKFDEHPALYNEINPVYGSLAGLGSKREERINLLSISSEIMDNILDTIESETLTEASKEYPEFEFILKSLKYIEDNKDIDTTDKEEEFLECMEDISAPYMRTIIMSDKRLITLYNKLVELYKYFSEKNGQLENKDAEILSTERKFTDEIKEITKKAAVMKIIQENTDFASIYNDIIDLFNHYVKKMELSKSIRDL